VQAVSAAVGVGAGISPPPLQATKVAALTAKTLSTVNLSIDFLAYRVGDRDSGAQ
jgi:hypothetical protein